MEEIQPFGMYLKHDKALQLVGECPTQDVSRVSEFLSAMTSMNSTQVLKDTPFNFHPVLNLAGLFFS